MKINFTKVLSIIIFSALLGIIVNSLSSRGISLVYEKKEIRWGNDSLVNLITESENINPETTDKPDIAETKETPDQKAAGIQDKQANLNEEKETLFEPVKINLETAFKLYNKNVFFVDARPAEEFAEGHIQGAYNVPYYSEEIDLLLQKFEKADPVVVYCNGTDCDLSIMLGNKMSEMGYKKVFVFFGGWHEWLENKYPVETPE
jgi:rhodanese-related sulfurtransferase